MEKVYAEYPSASSMETAGPRSEPGVARSTKWSLTAGAYLLSCAIVLLLVTRQVTGLVAELLGLPSGSVAWLAAPVPVAGAAVWWAAVERRGRYTYLYGVAVGLATAILTVLFWVLRGVFVWGPELVASGWPLVFAVLVPTVPAGLVAESTLMYARRRLDEGRSNGQIE